MVCGNGPATRARLDHGNRFTDGQRRPIQRLLSHIGDRLHTADRRTIAAAFALRYGWSAGMAIAPYMLRDCVPTITLDNVSFKFRDNTLFERVALHHPTGVMLHQEGGGAAPSHTVASAATMPS